ncbi:hypothetical protein [uncultured Finegoldia sp.]|uniref:hypothetical protein n=1 Tax=uncultured Finegoldia sp. TaxID=328009 RepID=UPI002631068D|nr:hypothetical protein [uncultured Finegoldia sp.]
MNKTYKNTGNFALAISNALMVVFVSMLLKNQNIVAMVILLAWAVYAYRNKMIVAKTLQRKRTKLEYASFLVLLVGFMLIYYHPNKVYVFLTYFVFVIYNTILWINMVVMRALENSTTNPKQNKKSRKKISKKKK